MTDAINAKSDALTESELDAVTGGSIKEIMQQARENRSQLEALQVFRDALKQL